MVNISRRLFLLRRFSILTVCLSVFLSVLEKAQCQKLPNLQKNNQLIPFNVKIDGKADEWNGQFQAYNRSTNIYYSIANNERFLYLIIKAEKPRIVQKIIYSGITLTVSDIGKNNSTDGGISITYPVLDLASGTKLLSFSGKVASAPPVKNKDGADSSIFENDSKIDSGMFLANRLLTSSAKTIETTGKSGSKGKMIMSIYNDERIQVASFVDATGAFLCEFLIPISYFELKNSSLGLCNYNVRLNGRLSSPKKGMVVRYTYPKTGGDPIDKDIDLNFSTDFSAQYIFLKRK